MGILTNEATVRQPRKQLCSTPFGIMGILTGGVANLAKVFVRAQRLSASWEFSLRWLQPTCLLHLASLFSRIYSFCFNIPFPQR